MVDAVLHKCKTCKKQLVDIPDQQGRDYFVRALCNQCERIPLFIKLPQTYATKQMWKQIVRVETPSETL